MAGEHACAVDGCTATAKAGQLMCWPHWKRLPRRLQFEVNDTWRRYRRDPEAYLSAKAQAVAWWREQDQAPTQGELL